MPQTNVLADWKANYPRDAAAQKPGGVTISTALIANAVPNKTQPFTATIQMVSLMEEKSVVEGNLDQPIVEAPEELDEEIDEPEEHDENGDPKPRRRSHHKVKHRR
jgi:hypothetical protein